MIGLTPRTSSPSSSTTSRSTPCVAGWCGPMLTVISSSVRSSLRSGVLSRSVLNPTSAVRSAITALVVGEGDGLAADREVAPLRPADVVVGQQDPGQVRMAAEDDPEEVVDLALLEVGGGEQLDAGVDGGECVLGRRVGQHRFDPDALHPVAVEELVVDGEARVGGEVVDAVQAGEEAVAVAGLLAQPAQHLEDLLGVGDQRRLATVEGGGEDGAGVVTLDFPPDQLQSRGVS